MNKEILKRYFEGQASKWETEQVAEYLEGDDLSLLDEYMLERFDKEPKKEEPIDKNLKRKFYLKLRKRLPKDSGKSHIKMKMWQAAAIITVFITLGGLWYLKSLRSQPDITLPTITSITNDSKVLKRLQLPDGTQVWLNPGAVLSFQEKTFADSIRKVQLVGEAFFDVTHDKTKPFVVESQGMTTRVLGTAFLIEAYENEPNSRITLIRGSVQVTAAHKDQILVPGQSLTYDKNSNSTELASVETAGKFELFSMGKLVFEHVPLPQVFSRMENAFGVKINLNNPEQLKDKHLTGEYYRNDVEKTLKRILFIHGLTYKKEGENVYVIE